MNLITYLTLFSAVSFLFFGIACFSSRKMETEFERYGLAPYRKIVGGLQLLGAVGLLAGIWYQPSLQPLAAGGLTLLMLLGFLVRLRIRDSFVQSTPSLSYALLNGFIFYTQLPLLSGFS